jgi:hypothetical protein
MDEYYSDLNSEYLINNSKNQNQNNINFDEFDYNRKIPDEDDENSILNIQFYENKIKSKPDGDLIRYFYF